MTEEQLYRKFARYYDRIYEKIDLRLEVDFIKWAAEQHKPCGGNKLLDIACGTGRHAQLLKNDFDVFGVDINPEMLKIAREKLPDINFSRRRHEKIKFRGKI